MRPVVIGTRGSALAMRQARIVQSQLEAHVPDRAFQLQVITAQADKNPELLLVAMGGEGVFVKELERALLDGQIDMAVHSLKDLPLDTPATLSLAAVLEREEPRDALIARSGERFEQLPQEARIGTSSLRRRSQLLHRRRDLQMCDIRGNVDTRLRKLHEGQYDAIVVAACGLIRLGLDSHITELLDLEHMLPEPGQGALAVEARADDLQTRELLGVLEDPLSRACIEAERAFLRALGGGCRVPIAAYAASREGALELQGAVVKADGTAQVRGTLSGAMTEPATLGERLAEQLSTEGAKALLETSRR